MREHFAKQVGGAFLARGIGQRTAPLTRLIEDPPWEAPHHTASAAAIVGDADAVRRLLDLGLGVDSPDSQGCTALLLDAATTEAEGGPDGDLQEAAA